MNLKSIYRLMVWIGLFGSGLCLLLQNSLALRGWLAGWLVSLTLITVWAKRIQKAAAQNHILPKKAFTFFFFTYIMMYFLVAILLYLAIQRGFSFFGAFVLGLLSVKAAIFWDAAKARKE